MSALRFRLSAGRDAHRRGPRWRSLLELGARLPGGLVHAERITTVPEPPPYLEPLVAGSRWHALGAGLVVAVGEGELDGLLADLYAYRALADDLRARLGGVEGAAEALEAADLAPGLALELEQLLEARPGELAALFGRAPGLRRDFGWMLRRAFDPEIVVHPGLDPERQRAHGAQMAEQILARIPAGRFHLLVADHPTPLELLSPYPSDLGHSLYQWGIENPEALPVAGLADALAQTQDAPTRDLASAVAEALMAASADPIRVERRENEAAQGLWLSEAWGATWGVADLERLEAPDPVVPNLPGVVIALVLGGPEQARLEAVARLARSGRLEGLGVIARSGMTGAAPLVPEAVTWSDDAIRLELGVPLARMAQRVGLPARRVGAVEVSADAGAPGWVAKTLTRWRRARITGALDAQAKPVVALAPRGPRLDLVSAQAAVNTAKIVLSGLLDPELGSAPAAKKGRGLGRDGGVSRRFRA